MASLRLIENLLQYLNFEITDPAPPNFGIYVRPGYAYPHTAWDEIPASRMLYSFLYCALDQANAASTIYQSLKDIVNPDYHATQDLPQDIALRL
ncbi:hypothetical protein FRB93_001769 [Tulasnella sp. JGI-2019a]|nr:hypothetical protein FRB93_001769 [Tulasnella sp. JGI-2019a]